MLNHFNLIYTKDLDSYIEVCEGDGTNLLEEDEEEGFVDYIYYTCYKRNTGDTFEEEDGGQIMLKHLYQDYKDISDIIRDVLEFITASDFENWIAITPAGEPISFKI